MKETRAFTSSPLKIDAYIATLLCIQEAQMRTTLNLPEKLIHEAMTLTRSETKTSVIILALQELVRKSKISGLKNYKGEIDLDIDLEQMRNRH